MPIINRARSKKCDKFQTLTDLLLLVAFKSAAPLQLHQVARLANRVLFRQKTNVLNQRPLTNSKYSRIEKVMYPKHPNLESAERGLNRLSIINRHRNIDHVEAAKSARRAGGPAAGATAAAENGRCWQESGDARNAKRQNEQELKLHHGLQLTCITHVGPCRLASPGAAGQPAASERLA
jgi:hypothetical protein